MILTLARTAIEKRHIANTFYGDMGGQVRRVCPSCVVRMIRVAYPSADGDYMGFRPR